MTQKIEQIQLFIDCIFQDLNDGEHVLFWSSSKTRLGFPRSQQHFMSHALRGTAKKACYFSTSTVCPDDEGKLYNRQKLFQRMFCIVLDDIGTGIGSKCKVEDLPDELAHEYTWRLETSPDNFQYGFLLDEPIEDLNAAAEFVKIVYGAGPWDSGGAMPNKLVRLPCGVNLKDKYATDDGALWTLNPQGKSLLTLDGLNVFSPDEILTCINAGVTWDDIKKGTASKLDPRRTRGATAWREGAYRSNLHGVVDDVLEWLNDEEMIVNENGEWVDIICPWADEHTDGVNTAGYKPLGYGDTPERRGFHCFHSHCKDNNTPVFLGEVSKRGGPLAPVTDPIPFLVSKWALDMKANEFINLQAEKPLRLPHTGFKNGHQEAVWWTGVNGKPAKATQFSLISTSPGLLKLMGSKYLPGGPRIIEEAEDKQMNDWYTPNWTAHKLTDTQKDWAFFCDFIHYLMPEKNDAEWFLDHLAAKAQDPKYRGPCTILTTPVQGSGRGALGMMLSQLWGHSNIATVGLTALIKGLMGDGFNDWLKSTFLIISEAKESTTSARQEARAYESLKTGVDPRPTSHIIKTKYGGEGACIIYSTYIICSNHEDVLNIPPTDRRFKTIHCEVKAALLTYFDDLEAWMHSNWEVNVWHELLNRDIAHHSGHAPQNILSPEDNAERLINSISGQSNIDRLVTISTMFADAHCKGVLHVSMLCDWISQSQVQLKVSALNSWEGIYKRELKGVTAELKYKDKRRPVKINGRTCYTRHTLTDAGYATKSHVAKTGNFDKIKDAIQKSDADKFRDFVLAAFNEAGV